MKPLIVALGIIALQIPNIQAADYTVPLSRTENVSGIPVTFTGQISSTIPDQACVPGSARVIVHLNDLSTKLLGIIKSTGIEKNEKCGDKLSLSGARIFVSGSNLGVKIDGSVGRQECIKTKVPEFKGLKVTMKTRVVASNTFRTNASIEAFFRPRIENNVLKMDTVGSPTLRVSNDIYRELVRLFKFDEKIEGKLHESLQKTLVAPKSQLSLQDELAGFQLVYNNAEIVTDNSKPSLLVSAEIAPRQPLFTGFTNWLASKAGLPPANTPQCS